MKAAIRRTCLKAVSPKGRNAAFNNAVLQSEV